MKLLFAYIYTYNIIYDIIYGVVETSSQLSNKNIILLSNFPVFLCFLGKICSVGYYLFGKKKKENGKVNLTPRVQKHFSLCRDRYHQ